jgi:hypothetical protein
VTRLVLTWQTTKAMGMLVRRFPAVVSVEFKSGIPCTNRTYLYTNRTCLWTRRCEQWAACLR